VNAQVCREGREKYEEGRRDEHDRYITEEDALAYSDNDGSSFCNDDDDESIT